MVSSLTSLDQKRDVLLLEIAHLQDVKKEQSKQLMSEIRALTLKRNLLLKQTKELFTVVQDLEQKKTRVSSDIDNYVTKRMTEIGAVGSSPIKVDSPTSLYPSAIIK